MTNKQLEQDRHAFLKALAEDKYDRSTHQAFADWLYEQGEDTLAHYHVSWTKEKQDSEDFITNIAQQCGTNFAALVQAGHDHLDIGTYLTLKIEKPYLLDMKLFWTHFSVVTGRKVKKKFSNNPLYFDPPDNYYDDGCSLDCG